MVDRSDKYTVSSKVETIFSDFLNNLTIHPGNKQLIRITNETAVKNSIANLLKTNRYSRFFHPEIGSNIRKLLFRNITPQTSSELQVAIEETIKNYEPRAKLTEVTVNPLSTQNAYEVIVGFYLLNKSEPVTFTTILTRVR